MVAREVLSSKSGLKWLVVVVVVQYAIFDINLGKNLLGECYSSENFGSLMLIRFNFDRT